MTLRTERTEQFRIFRGAAEASGQEIGRPPSRGWMGSNVLQNLGPADRCGLRWSGWSGDRDRGWGFYCYCGFCTPMRRSYSEVMDLLERHWQSGRPA
jgi:hypothetical protein